MKSNLSLVLAAMIFGMFGVKTAQSQDAAKNNPSLSQSAIGAMPQPQNPRPAQNTTDANPKSDENITIEIQKKIRATDGLADSARNVQVDTRQGRVKLTGTVDKIGDKDQLSEIAATIVPAENVDNEVTVATASLTLADAAAR